MDSLFLSIAAIPLEGCDPCIGVTNGFHRDKRFLRAAPTAYTDAVMMRRTCVYFAAAVTLAAPAFLANAHHGSSVSYYIDQTMTIAGTVTEWEFVNPHPQIYFDVKTDKGEVEHWATELLPTPSMMRNMKAGWSRTTIKPGDQIVLVCNPPRAEGAKACLARTLTVNGKDWPLGPGAPGGAKGKGKQ